MDIKKKKDDMDIKENKQRRKVKVKEIVKKINIGDNIGIEIMEEIGKQIAFIPNKLRNNFNGLFIEDLIMQNIMNIVREEFIINFDKYKDLEDEGKLDINYIESNLLDEMNKAVNAKLSLKISDNINVIISNFINNINVKDEFNNQIINNKLCEQLIPVNVENNEITPEIEKFLTGKPIEFFLRDGMLYNMFSDSLTEAVLIKKEKEFENNSNFKNYQEIKKTLIKKNQTNKDETNKDETNKDETKINISFYDPSLGDFKINVDQTGCSYNSKLLNEKGNFNENYTLNLKQICYRSDSLCCNALCSNGIRCQNKSTKSLNPIINRAYLTLRFCTFQVAPILPILNNLNIVNSIFLGYRLASNGKELYNSFTQPITDNASRFQNLSQSFGICEIHFKNLNARLYETIPLDISFGGCLYALNTIFNQNLSSTDGFFLKSAAISSIEMVHTFIRNRIFGNLFGGLFNKLYNLNTGNKLKNIPLKNYITTNQNIVDPNQNPYEISDGEFLEKFEIQLNKTLGTYKRKRNSNENNSKEVEEEEPTPKKRKSN